MKASTKLSRLLSRNSLPDDLRPLADRALTGLKAIDLNRNNPESQKAIAKLCLPEIEEFALAYAAHKSK